MELFNPNVGNNPLTITYYAYHFLKKGSFSYEGRIDAGQWIEGRIDPIQLANYLEYVVRIEPRPEEQTLNTFRLFQNYPNPFNPTTVISYRLPTGGEVKLIVYDQLGKQVRNLVNKTQPAGLHKVEWNGMDDMGNEVASGVYIYQLRIGEHSQSQKMVLTR
ncbi:MAG: T9SS type A sorting domain-containing protein [Aliifodinibius sp.]|nr:T9SS type A sorting domain-containing protein [Fodinibius sp.]NIW43924.1 T9SS type A sorting domain-containing protein [Gammaproteobacteria bacterium]NIY24320.1 T9SS type A sorting domain-containing protein [Fodinibius sp.]